MQHIMCPNLHYCLVVYFPCVGLLIIQFLHSTVSIAAASDRYELEQLFLLFAAAV